jgi:hypothetical protein
MGLGSFHPLGGVAMKRQTIRKIVPKAPVNRKVERHPTRKLAHKFVQSAQMTNYLLEEHPEFGQC